MSRLHIDVFARFKSLGYDYVWALTSELLKDHTSHSFAAMQQWSYVPAAAEVASMDLFEAWFNVKARQKNSDKYTSFPRSWESTSVAEAKPRNPERSARNRERLEQMEADRKLALGIE